MLSRLLEEGGTQTNVLIPWSTAGAFLAGTLGVATLSYLPYTLPELYYSITINITGLFGHIYN